ncbi:uncharacterized protein GGS22DRAFT_155359 [Annulohypoxylon maeteangense]|uniref:uncharacterized protein n=1 Tax=Annulohypoxylon maeteangense TaxID=1927788 RepID=UPI0020077C4A|nr:uncharacterized protein GGS22DRAFT_155359 [Annulohypoxylon maeteangense]KAI0888221.1 hypothetical protein GGS22DRAFT_155359 [Annulohypoxylon maeteangense]
MPWIDKIIAFGLGVVAARASRKSHQIEHAIALTIARTLEEKNASTRIGIYLQDPGYTSACKEALSLMGFQVIGGHGAHGFTMINEHTFVMSHNAPIPIREIVADIARPAAMYWKPELADEELDIDPDLRVSLGDIDSVRTRRMMVEYDPIPIPGASIGQHPYYDFASRLGRRGIAGEPFGNSALYVKKPSWRFKRA